MRKVRSPAVVVIGDVVRLSPHADGMLSDAAQRNAPRWTDAFTAGLAVDTGLTRVVESALSSRSSH